MRGLWAALLASKIIGSSVGGRIVRHKEYAPHPCWRCGQTTTRYALCNHCHRNPPKAEQRGCGDYIILIAMLNKYEKAAAKRLKSTVKRWTSKDYTQEELKAILEK